MPGTISRRQPTCVVPLAARRLLTVPVPGGIDARSCELSLWVRGGARSPVYFRADTGCDVSQIGIDLARVLRDPLPPASAPAHALENVTASGSEQLQFQLGTIEVWWNATQQGTRSSGRFFF